MDDIGTWLRQHGLGDYVALFEAQRIEVSDLALLTDADLRELELPLGPRKRLLAALDRSQEKQPQERQPQERQPQERQPQPSAADVGQQGRPTAGTGQAERRQLTLLFADLVGSTELAQRVDMEDLREITRAYQSVAEAAIQQFGGHIARYMGDGILAYFGYPLAHEDDAERAIRAGLALVDQVPSIAVTGLKDSGLTLAVRVGIATGPVLVGDVVGEGGAQEWVAVGETPNLAARIEASAAPNTVAVAPTTHRLTEELFAFEALGALALKGIDDPVEVWRVAAAREVTSRFNARHTTALTPLVGRDDELELLLRRWGTATLGEGHVVALSGEPGIGKSRLCEALRGAVEAQPQVWLQYQCSPHHVNSPFHPFRVQLTFAADLNHRSDPERAREALEALLRATPGCSDDEVTPLVELLDLGTPEAELRHAPEERKARIIGALLGQFRGLTRTAPVLCVFEDVHWADASTIEVLDHLIPQLDGLPALLVLTTRPEFNVPWTGQAGTTLLSLGRMGARDSVRMVEAAFRSANLPTELVEHIAARADGVPLFIEELTQAALEMPGETTGPAAGLAGNASDDLTIPETLRDALTARLDRNPAARETAQIASVIGRDFDYALLVAASGTPAGEVEHGLGLLVDSGLVQLRGRAPHAQCRFKHALIRDAAYASLTRQRRMSLHLGVAEILSAGGVVDGSVGVGAAEESPALIAYHFTEAGATAQGIEYWAQAGDEALLQGAQPEAGAHFQAALGLLETLDPSPARGHQELSLLLRLGQAQFGAFGGAAPQTVATYGRAAQLGAEFGDLADRCRAHYGLHLGLSISADFLRGLEVADDVAALATPDERWPTVVADRLRATCLYLIGRLHEARDALERVNASVDEVPAGFGHDPVLTAASTLPHIEWSLGFPDSALEHSGESLRSIRDWQTNPNTLSFALVWHMILATLVRDEDVLRAAVVGLRAHTERTGGKFWANMCRWGEGVLLVRTAQPAQGLATIREGTRGFMASGALQHVPMFRVAEAEALIVLEDHKSALEVLDEVAELVERTSQTFAWPEGLRLRGEAQLALGHVAEAEPSYREALRLAHEQDSRSWQLRAATSLARLLCEQDRRDEGHAVLAPAYAWFTEGFGTRDLTEARVLLNELG